MRGKVCESRHLAKSCMLPVMTRQASLIHALVQLFTSHGVSVHSTLTHCTVLGLTPTLVAVHALVRLCTITSEMAITTFA